MTDKPKCCPRCERLEALIEMARNTARNRNPDRATILDFLSCWNEQYQIRNAELEAENADLLGACQAVWSDWSGHDMLDDPDWDGHETLAKVRAAIAKATARQITSPQTH